MSRGRGREEEEFEGEVEEKEDGELAENEGESEGHLGKMLAWCWRVEPGRVRVNSQRLSEGEIGCRRDRRLTRHLFGID